MSEEDKSPPDWTVTSHGKALNKKTNLPLERTHKLRYHGREIDSAKGVTGLRAMQQQAAFANERGLKPSEAACRADGAALQRMAKENEFYRKEEERLEMLLREQEEASEI